MFSRFRHGLAHTEFVFSFVSPAQRGKDVSVPHQNKSQSAYSTTESLGRLQDAGLTAKSVNTVSISKVIAVSCFFLSACKEALQSSLKEASKTC